jgi:hypothetical protein
MFDWKLHAWCLMGTQLLIEASASGCQSGLSASLACTRASTAAGSERHLFEEHHSGRFIRYDDQFENAVEYILNNPVPARRYADRRD